jgi:hypothetical protein
MAHKSAWGRWFAAQHLVANGRPIAGNFLLGAAARRVMAKILDGDLEIHGRIRDQNAYIVIPRTDWRGATFHFVPNPETQWEMLVAPIAGTIAFDGTGSARIEDGPDAINHLRRFDSFLVDSRQFENLWPIIDSAIDKKRQQLLKEAQKRHLDPDTIKELS